MNHVIVYCSPNSSTRHVAEVIADRLLELGHSAVSFDLGQKIGRQGALGWRREYQTPNCLWVGSPVYVDHLVPPVERFVLALPRESTSYAVPFVTWGGVSSGVALYELGQLLNEKGCVLLGAAKVLAVHSSMWRSSQPLGEGHPNADDDTAVRSLVDTVHQRICNPDDCSMALEALDYQSQAIKAEALKKSLASAKQAYPELAVQADKCTRCGICAENCPAEAITLDPLPQFGEDCFICLKCVRECPEDAIPRDMSAAEERLRGMAAVIHETPPTQIFT